MTLGTPGSDHQRVRTALSVALLGVAFLLFVWINAVCRATPVLPPEARIPPVDGAWHGLSS